MSTILVINPGSTSTKLALYELHDGGELKESCQENISHDPARLADCKAPLDQLQLRLDAVFDFLERQGDRQIDVIAARGGLVRPITAGSYAINDHMIDDLTHNRYGSHVSNLGALIAHRLGQARSCPALIADPVGVDEFEPLARYSGLPGMERRCQSHALNIRATARQAAHDMGSSMEKLRLVMVHLGGGFSIAPLAYGKIIDVNNAHDGGPFSPQRCGTLPTTQLVDLAFSGKYAGAGELKSYLTKRAGLTAYLGTDNGREIAERIAAGDEKAREVYEAMAYQIAKEIGAMATVLGGRVDAIVLTGGLARPPLSDWIAERTSWIAPNKLYPGEHEMRALAEAGYRYLSGQETLQEY
jgi:butyrate kinase